MAHIATAKLGTKCAHQKKNMAVTHFDSKLENYENSRMEIDIRGKIKL
jgi:hypothetical protein